MFTAVLLSADVLWWEDSVVPLFKWLTAHWCGSTFGLSCSARSVFAGLALPWWQACCNTATVNYQVNAATLWNAHLSPLFSSLSSSWFSLVGFGQVVELLSIFLCTVRGSNWNKWRSEWRMGLCTALLYRGVSASTDVGWRWILPTRIQESNSEIRDAQEHACFSKGLRNSQFSKSSTYLAGKLVLIVGIFLLVVSILDGKINQF